VRDPASSKPLVGDPAYYTRKELAGRPSLAVGLLLDVSGSMGRYMPVVEQTTAVFCQGLLPIPGIDFAAWWYTAQSGKMVLTGICERRYPKLCLANVTQGGETPSGAAIAGVKVLMERMSGKQQLLIHFTDGRPDCPIHVRRAVQACRDADIQVYAIGPSRYWELLASEYGRGNYETMEDVSELPQVVGRLVKKLGVSQG
jgi:nitric oxide reductase activation protein